MIGYRHRQCAGPWRGVMIVGIVVLALGLAALGLAEPRQAQATVFGMGLLVTALLGVVAWLFGSLTVSVDEAAIAISFGPGWPRRSIPLSEVRHVEPVRNAWWYGWGIRWTPHGWLWNVAGLEAVEIELVDGRRIRIGTDRPDELASAIVRAVGGGDSRAR